MNMIVFEIPFKNPTVTYCFYATSGVIILLRVADKISSELSKVLRHRYKIHGLQPTFVE
jgi:hypothetical protein